MTMTLVQTVTVGAGGAASIEFTGIPQTGTDLLVVYSLRQAAGGQSTMQISFNGANYPTNKNLLGNGATASSNGSASVVGYPSASTDTANTFGNTTIYFSNYSSTTSNKSFTSDSVSENNGATAYQLLSAGLWASTAAITSISMATGSNWAQYSTASLYLVTKGSGGASVS